MGVMMKLFGFVFFLLLGSTSFASNTVYEIKSELFLAGNAKATPVVKVLDGEKATISVSGPEGEFTAKLLVKKATYEDNAVDMELEFMFVNTQRSLNIHETAIGSAREGVPAVLHVYDNSSKDLIVLSVIVTKGTL